MKQMVIVYSYVNVYQKQAPKYIPKHRSLWRLKTAPTKNRTSIVVSRAVGGVNMKSSSTAWQRSDTWPSQAFCGSETYVYL